MNEKRTITQNTGLVAGIAAFLLLLIFPVSDEMQGASAMAAVAALMATWWMTEAVPLAATSLLPLVLFPVLGLMSTGKVAPVYMNSTIFLFLGGFLLAIAMKRWDLHRRVSLIIIKYIGKSPAGLIGGFMTASLLLSMIISNTATTIMMMPIGLAVVFKLEESYSELNVRKFAIALMLGIAYASSAGGIATLVGTVPNLVFQRIFAITFPQGPEITFGRWIFLGVPLSLIMLVTVWLFITKIFYKPAKELKIDKEIIKKEYRELGRIRYEEKALIVMTAIIAFLWIFRKQIVLGDLVIPGWSGMLGIADVVDDGTVAIFIASLLFIIPAKTKKKTNLLDKQAFVEIPWDIILLFGGGFALALGFQETKLSELIGQQFVQFKGVPDILIIFMVCIVLTFLTELTSNTATTNTILPILASLAVAMEINPMLLMIPATISASFAFMLPVATPPNAIVFGSGKIKIADMVRIGVFLNFAGAIILTLYFYFYGKIVFNIDPAVFPSWAMP